MEVLIDNRQSKYRIDPKKIRKKAKVVLNALDCSRAELSILIVDDTEIEALNQKFLNRNGPTNVIAFPMRTGQFSDITPHLLGDVVISIETAANEGERYGISLEERFTQLLVHGILHLLGYDHEKTKEEAENMGKKCKEILKTLKVNSV